MSNRNKSRTVYCQNVLVKIAKRCNIHSNIATMSYIFSGSNVEYLLFTVMWCLMAVFLKLPNPKDPLLSQVVVGRPPKHKTFSCTNACINLGALLQKKFN